MLKYHCISKYFREIENVIEILECWKYEGQIEPPKSQYGCMISWGQIYVESHSDEG